MENNKNTLNIGLAIIVAGIIIGGAILLKGGKTPTAPSPTKTGTEAAVQPMKPVSAGDFVQGNSNSKVVLVEYADYQCPFCGAVFGLQPNSEVVQYLKQKDATWTPFMPGITNDYIKTGKIEFVYRDYAFLGPESIKAAEATRCANDQGKYWEYHNYLFGHQNGENKGGFADKNLKIFAVTLGLNADQFNSCLDSGKYTQAITDAKTDGDNAGVGASGTPKGYILKDGKVVATIDGAEPFSSVKAKLDAALQ